MDDGVVASCVCRSFKAVRRGILVLLLSTFLSVQIPDVSVVRAQEIPGLYAPAQGGSGNSGWVASLINPFTSMFAGQQTMLPPDRPRGFSFMAEGLYMNLRSDAQVFSQNVTTTTTTYLGTTTGSSLAPGNFQSLRPDRVRGLKLGLGYTLEDWERVGPVYRV